MHFIVCMIVQEKGELMEKRLFLISTGCISLFLLIFGSKYALGFLVGSLVSLLNYNRIERMCTNILSAKIDNKKRIFLSFMLNYGFMALTLILCAVKSDRLNIFTAALGLMMSKLVIVFNSLILERRR